MQKNKYFFSLVILIVAFSGFFGEAMEAGAADCCYNNLSGTASCDTCLPDMSNCIEDPVAAASLGVTLCPQKVSCSSSLCPASVQCCVDNSQTPPVCGNPVAGACTIGTLKIGACSTFCTTSNPIGTESTSTTFTNPITSNSISDVLGKLMSALSGLVITLAIIFIVLGGILYMMSAGDPGMIKRAKDCWLFSVIGLAIVVAAPTFLKEVMAILGGTLQNDTLNSALTITEIATNVMNFLLSVVGIIAIISLVIAGGMYMTAYGDDTQMGKAKKMAMWAVVGIAVALGSLVLVKQVADLIAGP